MPPASGEKTQRNLSLLLAWGATLFLSAFLLFQVLVIALGFLLFVVTFIVLAIAKWMLMRLARKEGN